MGSFCRGSFALAACLLCASGAAEVVDPTTPGGSMGAGSSLALDSQRVKDGIQLALHDLNVRVRHACPQQASFSKAVATEAAAAMIAGAVELQLRLLVDGSLPVRVDIGESPSGKSFYIGSDPEPCEVRASLMTLNDPVAIEKHNANPARTFDRASYKRFEGLTDTQILASHLGAMRIAGESLAQLHEAEALPQRALEKRRAEAAVLAEHARSGRNASSEQRAREQLEKASSSPVPSGWKCPSSWFGTGNGCDCDYCGAWDPDCESASAKVWCAPFYVPMPAGEGIGCKRPEQPSKSSGSCAPRPQGGPPDAEPAPEPHPNSESEFDLRSIFDGRCKPTIRDQGECGSCWAHATASMLEGRFCMASEAKVRPRLSVQQLVSCNTDCWPGSRTQCQAGCQGGYPTLAAMYMERSGIVAESALPYSCGEGSFANHFNSQASGAACPSNIASQPRTKMKPSSTRDVKGEAALIAALRTSGPVAVTFDVLHDFMTYRKGIYTSSGGEVAGGHAVTLSGYGEENGVKYWSVENSWGKGWGEGGFFRIRRGTNELGIEAGGTYAIADAGSASAASVSSAVVGAGPGAKLSVGVSARLQRPAAGGGASGFLELQPLAAPDGPPALRVPADGAEGLTSIDTSGLPAGVYDVRFCPAPLALAAGADAAAAAAEQDCRSLQQKLTVSACPVRDGQVCGGHGRCDEAAGSCACDSGFGGGGCLRECPELPRLQCGCATAGALWQETPSLLRATGPGGDALFALSLRQPATVSLSTCEPGTEVDTVLSLFRGRCPLEGASASGAEAEALASADDEGCGPSGGSRLPAGATRGEGLGLVRGSRLRLQLGAGEYVVAVSGYNKYALGAFNLTLDGCAPQDTAAAQCAAAAPEAAAAAAPKLVSASARVAANANANASSASSASSASASAPASTPASAAADPCAGLPTLALGQTAEGDLAAAPAGEAVYRLLPAAGGGAAERPVVVGTCGSASDVELTLHRGCPLSGGAQLGFSDDDCGLGGWLETQLPPAQAAQPYFARVRGSRGVRGRFRLSAQLERPVCDDAIALELAPPASRAESAGGWDLRWSGPETGLCAGLEPAAAAAGRAMGGPEYAQGAPHATFTLRTDKFLKLELDACAAPEGTKLMLFEGCPGSAGARALDASAEFDGACLRAQMWAGKLPSAGGPGARRKGALLASTVGPGAYTLVVSGRRVSAAELCRAFALEVRAEEISYPWLRNAVYVAAVATGGTLLVVLGSVLLFVCCGLGLIYASRTGCLRWFRRRPKYEYGHTKPSFSLF